MSKVYVGNLPFSITEDALKSLFENYGSIVSCNIIVDHNTGRSKGFAFVELSSKEEADAAIEALNESDLDGRTIKVNIAKDRDRSDRSRNHSNRNNRW
jgi:cold-inducible RNA-binding protein